MPAACRKRFSCFPGMLVLGLGTLKLKADPVGRGYWTAKQGCMVARENACKQQSMALSHSISR
jgi:hypothetical protein